MAGNTKQIERRVIVEITQNVVMRVGGLFVLVSMNEVHQRSHCLKRFNVPVYDFALDVVLVHIL